VQKTIVTVLLLLGGAAVFVFGSPYYTVFPTNSNRAYYVALVVVFLVASLALRRSRSLARYAPAAYSLCIASAALLFLSTGILNLHRDTMPPLQYLAMDKLSQALHVVPVIVGLTLLAGQDLRSLFLQRGRLRQGLIFGLVSFAAFGAIAVATQLASSTFFSSPLAALPWALLWIFANSFMEELWFRAIFLRQYEALVGRKAAILVTSLVFGASHINATYEFPGGGLVFGLVVTGLGLAGAYAMLKDDSLIGPFLFHAGYDLMVIVPVLATV
jgi:membrane protease YdiL (CAAX protease family)